MYSLLVLGCFFGLFNNYFELKLKKGKDGVDELFSLYDVIGFLNKPPNNG
jgi:hypothetical protein